MYIRIYIDINMFLYKYVYTDIYINMFLYKYVYKDIYLSLKADECKNFTFQPFYI